MKGERNMNTGVKHRSVYQTVTMILIAIIAVVVFLFPLYWIVTGSFKTPGAINSSVPEWWPKEWVMRNFNELFSKRSSHRGALRLLKIGRASCRERVYHDV